MKREIFEFIGNAILLIIIVGIVCALAWVIKETQSLHIDSVQIITKTN